MRKRMVAACAATRKNIESEERDASSSNSGSRLCRGQARFSLFQHCTSVLSLQMSLVRINQRALQ